MKTYDQWKSTNPEDEMLGPEPDDEDDDDPFAATRELDIVDALRSHEAHESSHIVASDLMHEAADEIEQMRAALKECADQLEKWVRANYAPVPSEKRRYDRYMAPVIKARKLLNGPA